MNFMRNKSVLRTLLWMVLVACIFASSPIRLASDSAAAAQRTEAEYRAETRRYEDALKLIAQVRTLSLTTPESFNQAFALIDRARPDMKFYFSKMVMLALSDAGFKNGIRKRITTKQDTDAFLNGLVNEPRNVLNIDGTDALKARLQQSASADASILTATANRLKSEAEKLRKAGHGRNPEDTHPPLGGRVIAPGFEEWGRAKAVPQGPVTIIVGILIAIFIVAVAVTVAATLGAVFGNVIDRLFSTQDKDGLAECQHHADDLYSDCKRSADQKPFPANIAVAAACYATWLGIQKDCLLEF